MNDLFNSPLFGIIISIMAYEIGLYLYRKTKISLFNPLLISITLIIVFLSIFKVGIQAYNKGGELISIFLGPATVILAVPLYKQLRLLRANLIPIIIGIAVGCISAVGSVYIFNRFFKINKSLGLSLIPKSITTPIGIEISRQIGGIQAVTVAAIILTGITGAVIGPSICKISGVRDRIAVGIALGTSSHAVGTTKAVEIGEIEGAMSGLAIGISGVITVLLISLIGKFL